MIVSHVPTVGGKRISGQYLYKCIVLTTWQVCTSDKFVKYTSRGNAAKCWSRNKGSQIQAKSTLIQRKIPIKGRTSLGQEMNPYIYSVDRIYKTIWNVYDSNYDVLDVADVSRVCVLVQFQRN